MADPKKAEVKKVKQLSAKKRDLQSQRSNLRNRAYKAKVNTAMRALKESIEKKDSATLKSNLDAVYSLMDKGVKTGIYKENKAGRVKSRLTKLASKA